MARKMTRYGSIAVALAFVGVLTVLPWARSQPQPGGPDIDAPIPLDGNAQFASLPRVRETLNPSALVRKRLVLAAEPIFTVAAGMSCGAGWASAFLHPLSSFLGARTRVRDAARGAGADRATRWGAGVRLVSGVSFGVVRDVALSVPPPW